MSIALKAEEISWNEAFVPNKLDFFFSKHNK